MTNRWHLDRNTLSAFFAFVWAVSTAAWRDFVWADLRAGLIDLRGLSRPMRSLIMVGFGLLLLMVSALLMNDAWRSQFELLARVSGVPGRGALVPVALVPLTLFMIAMAWSFALTGALHSHPLICFGVLLLFLMNGLGWTNTSSIYFSISRNMASPDEIVILGLGVGLTLAVPLFFFVRRRAQARPVLEFASLLCLVTGVLAVAQMREVQSWRQFGIPVILGTMDNTVGSLQGFVIPLLLLIGIDMAGFANSTAQWTTKVVMERLPIPLARGGFVIVLAWRLYAVLNENWSRVSGGSIRSELVAYAGALGVVAAVWLVWALVTRLSRKAGGKSLQVEEISEAVDRVALPLIVVYSAVQLVIFLMLGLALSIPPLDFGLVLQSALTAQSGLLNAQLTIPWRNMVAISSIVALVWLARRGHPALALYLGIYGCLELWFAATNPGGVLGGLAWSGPEPLDFWWMVVISGFGLYWLLARQLTMGRTTILFLLLVLTWLMRQTDFVGNRFAPFFGFAGVGFVAFGIIYDAITAGTWANVESEGLPRSSRIFLYIGYVLLTVTVVNWALTSHDLGSLSQLNGGAALVGMERFGRPMLYAIFVTLLTRPPVESTVQTSA